MEEMVDRETAREIAKVAAAEVALRVTEKMGEIQGDLREFKASIPGMISGQIRTCQDRSEKRRGRGIGTLITIVGIVVANSLAAYAIFGG